MVAGDETRRSDTYEDLGAVAAPFAEPLPEPPADADVLPFASGTLAVVRRLVVLRAGEADLSEMGTADLVLAVTEVATNSIRHGGGEGVLRAWLTDEMVIFEVADAGAIADPLAGRVRPDSGQSAATGCGCATRPVTWSSCARSPAAASCACISAAASRRSRRAGARAASGPRSRTCGRTASSRGCESC